MYSKAALDGVGVFTLDVQLQSFSSNETTTFENATERCSNHTIGQILIAVNSYLSIQWLPVGANRRYVHASRTVHSQLGEIIKQRIQEVKGAREGGRALYKEARKFKDLLTYMVGKK